METCWEKTLNSHAYHCEHMQKLLHCSRKGPSPCSVSHASTVYAHGLMHSVTVPGDKEVMFTGTRSSIRNRNKDGPVGYLIAH